MYVCRRYNCNGSLVLSLICKDIKLPIIRERSNNVLFHAARFKRDRGKRVLEKEKKMFFLTLFTDSYIKIFINLIHKILINLSNDIRRETHAERLSDLPYHVLGNKMKRNRDISCGETICGP